MFLVVNGEITPVADYERVSKALANTTSRSSAQALKDHFAAA